MAAFWGVHNDRPDLDLVENEFVSIGWPGVGDIVALGDDKDVLKARVAEVFPDAKPGAIPDWAGVLRRFAFEMQIGDLVLHPHKPDSTINVGKISGPYAYLAGERHAHRRTVERTHTNVPRTQFSQAARNEIGSAVTLFSIKTNDGEFRSYMAGQPVSLDPTGGHSESAPSSVSS